MARGRSETSVNCPGLRIEDEAAAARKSRRTVKENVSKNKQRMGEAKRKKKCDGSRERDEGAAQKETTKKRKRERMARGRGGKRTSTRNPDRIVRGRRYRPATGPPGLDHPGGLKIGTGTTRDEESVARKMRVRGGAENKKSRRPVKENMNKSQEWKGEETKNTKREERREGDEGAS